ncbi:hypothetical protein Tco_0166594 [Tanacetum coccineum]
MDPTNSRNLKEELKDHAIIDSGCSGSMTGDKDKLSYFKEYKGGYRNNKKERTAGTQAVLPQTKGEKGSVVTSPTQTWRPKGAYLDSVNRDNGSYTLKQFEYVTPLGVSKSVMTWVPKRV